MEPTIRKRGLRFTFFHPGLESAPKIGPKMTTRDADALVLNRLTVFAPAD